MFQNLNSTLLFTHAENEYAQVLEETGILGLVFLIIFGIIIFLTFIRNIRGGRGAIGSATYGLGFGIMAILVHSLSDFGQHVPANAFLTVIFCALLLAINRQGRQEKTMSKGSHGGLVRVVRVVVLAAVCVVFGYALKQADGARRGEEYWKQALSIEKGLLENDWKGTKKQYDDLIAMTEAAVEAQPGNMKYRYCRNVYQWYSMSRAVDNEFRRGDISGDDEYLSRVRVIGDELNEIRAVCPTFGPAYSMAGQIEKFILNEDAGAEKIRKGFVLAPCDPVACFVAGRLDIVEGNVDDAAVKFQKAVEIDGSFFKEVVNIYVMELSRPMLAVESAGEDVSRLVYVTEVLEDMLYEDMAESARAKTQKLLEETCGNGDATPVELATLAEIYDKQDEQERAIEHYSRALGLQYSNVYWRLKLSKLLAETGRVDEAMKHARICLRIRPQFKAAAELLGELSVLPGPLSRED
jgi:tetratricopeptide (TPR) repeat protein